MDDEDYKVSSEIYTEFQYTTNIKPKVNQNNIVSKFPFNWPSKIKVDADGDLIVRRKNKYSEDLETDYIEIEHSERTVLGLVGLQIWRGALLLADWLIHMQNSINSNSVILELGSGVGLTSIIAAHFAPVVCTDIDKGDILKLIKNNIERNSHILRFTVNVLELDFNKDLSDNINEVLPKVEIILAADVVYDDEITVAFFSTVKHLLLQPPTKYLYIALEKRYVFTISDTEVCAPCYDYFLECLRGLSDVIVEEIDLNFPQYFKYDRVKELVLWKITSKFNL